MSTDQLVILADGVVLGFDVALLIHFGGQIWDGHRARRAPRRKPAEAAAMVADVEAERLSQLADCPVAVTTACTVSTTRKATGPAVTANARTGAPRAVSPLP